MYLMLARIARDVLGYKLFGRRKPLVLSISITSRCNLQCAYCYSSRDNMNGKDLPVEELFGTIDAFHALGTQVVMLQGGEPLLHGDLDRIVSHVKSKGMYCAVTTNGVYVAAQLQTLKKVDQVQLSIDGNRAITDKYRGKGVYDSLLTAMALCRDNRIPFHLHTVVTDETTVDNTLLPLLELARMYETHLNFCFPAPTGAAEGARLASGDRIRDFYRQLLDSKDAGMPVNNSRRGIEDVIEWTKKHRCDECIPTDSVLSQSWQECIMGNLVCWLDSEGMLHPCAVKFGQTGCSHSIRPGGVAEAWRRLADKPCRCCANSTEFNHLFNFRLEAVLNSLKFFMQKRTR